MDLYDIMNELVVRAHHLSKLEQSGPVDLGPDDNAVAQDELFHELKQIRLILTYTETNLGLLIRQW